MKLQTVLDQIKLLIERGVLRGRVSLTDPKWIDLYWKVSKNRKKLRITVDLENLE